MSVTVEATAQSAHRNPIEAGNPLVCLVLGGARSGKSAVAEADVARQGGALIYLATSEILDGEMADRIALHRQRRGPQWTTVEEPLALCDALSSHAGPDSAVLVDCLTLWLSNLMAAERDIEAESLALADTLAGVAGPVVLVSSEVGQGIVPDNALARGFRDEAGRLHQRIAAVAGRVIFCTAGLPQTLKDTR